MDVQVEIGEGVFTTPAPAPPGSGGSTGPNLGEQAREEYAKVMSDPTHPHFDGLRRNSKEANAYVDGLYKKALPDSSPVTIQEGVSVTTGGPDDEPVLSPDDARAMEALRHEWGGDAAAHWADAQVGISRLTRTLGGEVDDLVAAVLAAGGDLRLVTNIVRHFGKQARTYAP